MKKNLFNRRIIVAICVLFGLAWFCLSNHITIADEADKNETIDDGIVVVSMGDSYSSGEGNTPFYGQDDPNKETNQDWLAHRSEASWPGRLTFEVDGTEYMLKDCRKTTGAAFDPSAKVSWYFVAASGAETKHINGQQKKEYCFNRYEDLDENGWLRTYETIKNEKDHPALLDPQINVFKSIPKGAVDYVTLTLGGNDARFGSVVEQWAITPAKSFFMINDLSNLIKDIWHEYDYGKYEIVDEEKIEEIKKKSDIEKLKEINDNHDIIYQRLVELYGEKKAKVYTNGLFIDIQMAVLHGEKIDGIKDRLKKAYKDICNAAGPQAKLVVVGYPQLFSGDKFLYFFSDDASNKVNNAIKEFNVKIQEIVKECHAEGLNIEFVSVEEEFKNHGAYSDKGKQWLHRIIFIKREEDLDVDSRKFINLVSSYSVHPNEKGLAAYARLVQKKIDELEKERKANLTISPTLNPTAEPSPEPTVTVPIADMPTPTPVVADNDSYKDYFSSYNTTDIMFVTRDDRYIFYINSGGCVVRMDADTGENRIFAVDNQNVDRIQVYGNRLLYHSMDDFLVYSVDFNGEDCRTVIPEKTVTFFVVEDSLYYIGGSKEEVDGTYEYLGDYYLYRYSWDTNNSELLVSEEASAVSILNDSIVYYSINDQKIMLTDLNGKNSKTILDPGAFDGKLADIKVLDDTIYYYLTCSNNAAESGIYRLNKDGTSELIISNNCNFFTFWDGRILYNDTQYGTNYICDLDGTHVQELSTAYYGIPLSLGKSLYGYYNRNPLWFRPYEYYFGYGHTDVQNIDINSGKQSYVEQKRYREVCFIGNYMFFIDDEDDCIYRCDIDGDNRIKLTAAPCSKLYACNNELYYVGYANGYDKQNRNITEDISADGLFKLDVNGDGCSAIDIASLSGSYVFCDDFAYSCNSVVPHVYRFITNVVTDTYGFNECKPYYWGDSSQRWADVLFVEDDWLYGVITKIEDYDNSYLARLNLLTGKKEIIASLRTHFVDYASMCTYNNSIYYLMKDDNGNPRLRAMHLDGTGDHIVFESYITEFCISNGVVYYVDLKTGQIVRQNLDGTERRVIEKSTVMGIVLYQDRIFYSDLFSNGALASISVNGSDKRIVIQNGFDFVEKTSYVTRGIDDVDFSAIELKTYRETYKDITFDPNQEMVFEDKEFEFFLRVMLNKENEPIYGYDLLSIHYFGYCEFDVSSTSPLMNLGKFSQYYGNIVLFNTQPLNCSASKVLYCFDSELTESVADYRYSCTAMTVQSNEWMVEHVFPYLYYFKNLEWFAAGFCWESNICLPIGAEMTGINPHARYFRKPYDPEYE